MVRCKDGESTSKVFWSWQLVIWVGRMLWNTQILSLFKSWKVHHPYINLYLFSRFPCYVVQAAIYNGKQAHCHWPSLHPWLHDIVMPVPPHAIRCYSVFFRSPLAHVCRGGLSPCAVPEHCHIDSWSAHHGLEAYSGVPVIYRFL